MWPSFQNMIGPLGWAAVGLVPPAIVALYFLKLKRTPLEVPSTFLWKRSIEDMHVNSLWQRLRRNLLLFLQLLIVLLVALALLRPSWRGTRLSGDHFIFMIDNSASMSASDEQPSRLEQAKQQISALIDEMKSDDSAMIISFSDKGRVEQPYTHNRRDLHRALEAIQPTNRGTSLEEALPLAAAQANPGRSATDNPNDPAAATAVPAEMYIFSDGRFPDVRNFAIGNLTPHFVPVGKRDASNVGIIAFHAGRNTLKRDQLEAFARIGNFSAQQVQLKLGLYLRREKCDSAELLPLGTQDIDIAANRTKGASFPLPELSGGMLELRIEPNAEGEVAGGFEDALSLDNTAWTPVNLQEPAKVLFVRDVDPNFDLALTTSDARLLADIRFEEPSFLETQEYRDLAQQGYYDLIIYEGCRPKPAAGADLGKPAAKEGDANDDAAKNDTSKKPEDAADGAGEKNGADQTVVSPAQHSLMPQSNTFFLGILPPEPGWSSPSKVEAPRVVDVERSHPLMRYMNLGNLLIAESLIIKPPPAGNSIMMSGEGPMMAVAPRGVFQDAVLGFAFADATGPLTDWYKKQTFPTFALNLLQFMSREGRERRGVLRPGESLTIPLRTNAASVQVRSPTGRESTVSRSSIGTLTFNDTEDIGRYEVFQEGKDVFDFAVNLNGSEELAENTESNVTPRAADEQDRMFITIGHTEVEGRQVIESARREGWKWLLLLALAVLLLEWYIYNRRVYL